MSIVLRSVKGDELTFAEVDGNFSSLFYSSSVSEDKLNLHFYDNTSQSINLNLIPSVSASYAATASYVLNAQSASYVLQAVSASFADSSLSSSFASNSISSSYALTASYVQNAVTASFALNSPASTFSSSSLSASYASSSTSASYASTASFVQNAQSASYVLNAVSSSFASTIASGLNITASNILVTGTASIVFSQIITSSIAFTSGSNLLGANGSDTQTLWGTIDLKSGPLIISGSTTALSSITAPSFTGSLQGTSSWANNAITSSYILNAISSSYAATASYVQNAITASFALNSPSSTFSSSSLSSSYASSSTSASYATNALSASYAPISTNITNNTNNFILTATGGETINGENGLQFDGTRFSVTSSDGRVSTYNDSGQHYIESLAANGAWKKLIIQSNGLDLRAANGAILAALSIASNGNATFNNTVAAPSFTGSFTGSLFGTASFAQNAQSASYVLQAVSASFSQTASYVLNAVSSSFASTASFARNAQTASYVLNAVSSSFSTFAQNAFLASTASYTLYTSLADAAIYAQTALFATSSLSASFASSSISASYATNALSASFASSSTSASYSQNALSASFSSTASYVLNAVNSTQSISSSYAITSSYSLYAENANTATSAATAGSATIASIATSATSASYALTASYVQNAFTASYVLNAISSSFAQNAATASYVLNAVSASFASTASFVNPLTQSLLIGGSTTIVGNTIITGSFTVVTGSAVELQVTNTGVNIGNIITDTHTVTGSLNISGSTTIVGNTTITGSLRVSGSITGSLFGTSSWATRAISASNISGAISNNVNNYILTATGGGSITGEPTLQFDGITLSNGSSGGIIKILDDINNTQPTSGITSFVRFSALPQSIDNYYGETITGRAANTLVRGMTINLTSTTHYWDPADNTFPSSSHGLLGICLNGANTNDDITILLQGFVVTQYIITPTFVSGAPLWLDQNGHLTDVLPGGNARIAGHYYEDLGSGYYNIRFNPDNYWI